MSADRRAAAAVGVLFIVGTVALVLSFVVAGSVLAGTAGPADGSSERGAQGGARRTAGRSI